MVERRQYIPKVYGGSGRWPKPPKRSFTMVDGVLHERVRIPKPPKRTKAGAQQEQERARTLKALNSAPKPPQRGEFRANGWATRGGLIRALASEHARGNSESRLYSSMLLRVVLQQQPELIHNNRYWLQEWDEREILDREILKRARTPQT
jgi:hypothetical protein